MMSNEPFRKCKQCTIVKPIEQFRPYYNRKKPRKLDDPSATPRYLQCLTCESVNSAYKTAKLRGNTTRLLEIDEVYKACAALGGVIPGTACTKLDAVKLTADLITLVKQSDVEVCDPATLRPWEASTVPWPYTVKEDDPAIWVICARWSIDEWLTMDLNGFSSHEIDELGFFVVEPLKKYLMPIKCKDATGKLVHDTTNESVYRLILARY